jgi:RNA polymerase sigma-70 factor (ECF subfamily)
MADDAKLTQGTHARFHKTLWSVVLAAGNDSSPGAREALAKLCETYWYPIYGYLRRHGHPPHEAEDLTQGFFLQLITHDSFTRADQAKGAFRSFLLGALKKFLADEARKRDAAKRGGGVAIQSLDERTAEGRYVLEPADRSEPEQAYARNWAQTLLESVHQRLGAEYAARSRERIFDRLQVYLMEKNTPDTYAEVGAELGLSEGAVKVEVSRLRARFRELFGETIAETVAHPGEIEEEVRFLFAALEGKSTHAVPGVADAGVGT